MAGPPLAQMSSLAAPADPASTGRADRAHASAVLV